MEEGTRTKKTVFVGGISDDVDESNIYEHFSTFGAIHISTFLWMNTEQFYR
jgi:peptidyl-prolyl isomerase E (cyclophilin E)